MTRAYVIFTSQYKQKQEPKNIIIMGKQFMSMTYTYLKKEYE